MTKQSKGRAAPARPVLVAIGVFEADGGEVRVKLAVGDEAVHLRPEDARHTALTLMRAAELVETEGFLREFGRSIIPANDPERDELVAAMIAEFRRQIQERQLGRKAESA